ncbi:endolytic transglycosylase MltG [Gudongella sp. DL1XJH-153]|uniref:endolytic transglycosylase MltG n=1 Tax=Gudongella sp. DL1XJH-153 TaxID=3409804 RepID=UPI003BB7E4E0
MKKAILVLLLIILIAGVGGFFLAPDYLNSTHNDEAVNLVVEKGDTLHAVAEKLYEEGVIKSRLWFRYNGEEVAARIKPGTYIIERGSSLDDIYEIIQVGEQEVPVVVTFPEGFILYQFAEKIQESGLGTMEEFIEETERFYEENYSENYDNKELYYSLEGYLFPDTYHFSSSQTVSQIVERLVSTTEDIWTDEMEAKREELGMSRHQIMILASLIEREAFNDEERNTISGVIYNRIDTGMPLQIDATVIYGIGEGKEHMTRVLYSDLERENPFNTYRNEGMPPGPIASPGRNSINAALNPESHDFYYYVMGENGHVFAETYNEHLRNVEAYRQTQ